MTIRPAQAEDVEVMSAIIGRYASQGLMLPRSRAALCAALPQYVVGDIDGLIVGCGGLKPYSANLGEIFGLATAPGSSPRGTGSAIVQALVHSARVQTLSRVFALTLVPGFFEKLGFHHVEHRFLPEKVWGDCVACPKFGNCDEIAMVLDLA